MIFPSWWKIINLLLTMVLILSLPNNDANVTVMNLLTKVYSSKPKLSALVTAHGKASVKLSATESTKYIRNRRHLNPTVVTTESVNNLVNRSLNISTNNLKEFYLKKLLKYLAPEYDLVTVSSHLTITSTRSVSKETLYNNSVVFTVGNVNGSCKGEITTQRTFNDSPSEFYSPSFEISTLGLRHNISVNHNLTTAVTVSDSSAIYKTPTKMPYLRRVQKVMKSFWTPYPMRTNNMTKKHHSNTMIKNITTDREASKVTYSATFIFKNDSLGSNNRLTSTMSVMNMTKLFSVTSKGSDNRLTSTSGMNMTKLFSVTSNYSTLNTTKLVNSNISETVRTLTSSGITFTSSTLNSTEILTSINNMSLYTASIVIHTKLEKPEVTIPTVYNVSVSATTESDSVFRKLFPFLFKNKSTESKNNVNTNHPVFLTHNTSLISNHSNPALMIMNDTHVSVLSNESDISEETFSKSKNGTWYSRAGTVFTGWMGDVSKIWHCFTDPYVEPTIEDVHFYLYTRRNMQIPEELFVNITEEEYTTQLEYELPPVLEEDVNSSRPTVSVERRQVDNDEPIDCDDREEELEEPFEKLNPSKCVIHSEFFNVLMPTKIIIHGYTQTYEDELLVNIRQAYLRQASYNVIMVDWSTLAESPCYRTATKHTPGVAKVVSKFLDQLAEGGIEMDRIHIIGFSLGAQVAGFAGDLVSYGIVFRITGLDPALPYYRNSGPEGCLDASDASFVDVIHTSAGFLGQSTAQGHADFYPNGGSQQPGCDFSALACSHRRAAMYFAESINSSVRYVATQCTSWADYTAGKCNDTSQDMVYMGDPCPTNATGSYYLVTGESEPFGDVEEQEDEYE